MTSKKIILKLLELAQELDKTDKPIECSMIVNDMQKVVDNEVTKQLNILLVSQQRELLKTFCDYIGVDQLVNSDDF
jgi:hypothetical protein